MRGMPGQAQVPIKARPVAKKQALEKVRPDKLREVTLAGRWHLGAPPRLFPLSRRFSNPHMRGTHQISRKREELLIVTANESFLTGRWN